MRTLILSIGVLLALGSMSAAYACKDPCYLNGQWYPHGTRIGDSICECGVWKPV